VASERLALTRVRAHAVGLDALTAADDELRLHVVDEEAGELLTRPNRFGDRCDRGGEAGAGEGVRRLRLRLFVADGVLERGVLQLGCLLSCGLQIR
jgi:hypothetical protein